MGCTQLGCKECVAYYPLDTHPTLLPTDILNTLAELPLISSLLGHCTLWPRHRELRPKHTGCSALKNAALHTSPSPILYASSSSGGFPALHRWVCASRSCSAACSAFACCVREGGNG